MTSSTFQRNFARDLLPSPAGPAHPAMAVYRNTVMKGCIDALEANFPAVVRLVGVEWFRSAAALHVAQSPPRDARLLHYGEAFTGFLRRFEPAADLPYLAGVAELDRLWIASHTAADAPAMPADALAGLPPGQLGARKLTPHPATRWQWFEQMPIYSLWSRNRPAESGAGVPDGMHAPITWQGEGALLTRPAGAVCWSGLTAGGAALLARCAAGDCLVQAADAALAAEPDCDLGATLALLLRQGAFAAT